MRADKSDKDHLCIVPDHHNEPVFVATNVKDHPVIGEDTGAAVVRLDVGGVRQVAWRTSLYQVLSGASASRYAGCSQNSPGYAWQ